MLAAIAAAVVGPPTLALEAMSRSARFIPSFSPACTVKYRCVITCMKLKKNSAGAVDAICPNRTTGARWRVKNNCIAKLANASPLGANPPIRFGKVVASATVEMVTMGMTHCAPTPAAPATYVPSAPDGGGDGQRRVRPFIHFERSLESLAFKMTSALASSLATPWDGSLRSYAWSMSGAGVSLANLKSAEK